MKILKQIDIKEWAYIFTCTACDSELEANGNDLVYRHINGDMRDPGYDTWIIICPVCKHSTNVKEDKIPKAIKMQKISSRNTSSDDWTR